MRGFPLSLSLLFVSGFSWSNAWISTARVNPVAGIALFDPSPAKSWACALRNLARLEPRWAGLSGISADAPLQALMAASPLAQALNGLPEPNRLRRELERPHRLGKQERARLIATLDSARALAASKTQAEIERLLETRVRSQPDPVDDPQALRLRITELEALCVQLAGLQSLGLYGDPVSKALDETERKSQRLRQVWLNTNMDTQTQRLKSFLDDFHEDLLRESPDLFHRKMTLAAESDFSFLRAFPQLQYALLRESPHAEALRRTVVLRLPGDMHAENVEIVKHKGLAVPQINDFDESAKGPVGPELARLLAGAAFLGNGSKASMRQLAREARDGYLQALGMRFNTWARALSAEKSVAKAKPKDRDWARNVGPLILELELTRRLFQNTGLDPRKWRIYDRRGAGLSSIGLHRYAFLSREPYIHELKQLRSSALEFFTGENPKDSDAERLEKGWTQLRRVPTEHKVLALDAKEWLLRRREPQETRLNLTHPKSAARVLGGLAAQVHLGSGASAKNMRQALAAVPISLALDSADALARMRQSLIDLLNREAWGSIPGPEAPPRAENKRPAG